MSDKYEVKFSGESNLVSDSGFTREDKSNRPRMSLIPHFCINLIQIAYDNPIEQDVDLEFPLRKQMNFNDKEIPNKIIHQLLRILIFIDDSRLHNIFERFGMLLTRGAVNHGDNNWLKGENETDFNSFKESFFRHYFKLICEVRDGEDHFASSLFNLFGMYNIMLKKYEKK